MTTSYWDFHEVDRYRCCQLPDRIHSKSGRLQRRVQIAFLNQFRRLAEGQIIGAGEITIGKTGGPEDGARIELGARLLFGPTETRLPFRSARLLIPDASLTTSCT
jgi:hypothetical protein